MRIIGISGVWSNKNPVWHNLAEAFSKEFPVSEFIVEEERNCNPWEIHKLRRFAEAIVRKYDDGTETLLVGHSLGGVIACGIANRFKRTPIQGVVTIFSPHHLFFGSVIDSPEVNGDLKAPVISFSAAYDELVWWGAQHLQAVAHIILRSNHFTDLVTNNEHACRIASEAKAHLFHEA